MEEEADGEEVEEEGISLNLKVMDLPVTTDKVKVRAHRHEEEVVNLNLEMMDLPATMDKVKVSAHRQEEAVTP